MVSDTYYRTKNSEAIKFVKASSGERQSCLQKASNNFMGFIKFMAQFSIFGIVRTVLLDFVTMIKPVPLFIALMLGGDAPEKFEEFLINKVLKMCLGIRQENLAAFKHTDLSMKFYMVDLPILVTQAAAIVGLF